MSLLGRLASLGAVIGAAVFTKKVADRISSNNPEGVPDHNENGKVDLEDYAAEVKKAAGEVYHETADAIKEKAPDAIDIIKQTAEEVKSSVTDAYYDVKSSFSKPPEVIHIDPDSVCDAEEEEIQK